MLAVTLLMHVATFMLICQLWAVVANHEKIIKQEANPSIYIEREPTMEENIHDMTMRRLEQGQ